MNMIDIIDKKAKKKSLSLEEINFVVENFTSGIIKDYQMSSLLMAITINGMNDEEAFYLTNAMLNSGKTINLSAIDGPKVDKHSTGGIGDKTTLIVGSIVASAGVNFPKMSGRGLGYTGGTIDKLESIPGFRVNLSEEEFIKQLKDIKIAITSQTEDVAIADKKIYALRDVSATVSSIPLIASSIMSKKLATGCCNLVIDVKVGSGALLNNLDDAKALTKLMLNIADKNNKKMIAILTNMDRPLGNNIGNSLEIKEVIDTLNNKGPQDLIKVSLFIAAFMISLGKDIKPEDALKEAKEILEDGRAYKKFIELINYQGGIIDNLPTANKILKIKSNKTGYINKIDALKLGRVALNLGAGRMNKEDILDYSAGLVLKKQIGDLVEVDDVLLEVHTNKNIDVIGMILDAYEIDLEKKEIDELIYTVMQNSGR